MNVITTNRNRLHEIVKGEMKYRKQILNFSWNNELTSHHDHFFHCPLSENIAFVRDKNTNIAGKVVSKVNVTHIHQHL